MGRTCISNIALGEHHSIFLDSHGGVWACGENKEGQCGLGTPLEVIASQHRMAYHEAMRPRIGAGSSSGVSGASGMGSKDAPGSSGGGSGGRTTGFRPRDQQLSQYLKRMMQQDPPLHQQHRAGMQAFLQRPSASGGSAAASWAGSGIGGRGGASSSTSSGLVVSALGWGGFDMEGHMSGTGIQPGQLHTPMRIGRDQHPLSGLLHSSAQADPGENAGKQIDFH